MILFTSALLPRGQLCKVLRQNGKCIEDNVRFMIRDGARRDIIRIKNFHLWVCNVELYIKNVNLTSVRKIFNIVSFYG